MKADACSNALIPVVIMGAIVLGMASAYFAMPFLVVGGVILAVMIVAFLVRRKPNSGDK